jgi:hypothetical protein
VQQSSKYSCFTSFQSSFDWKRHPYGLLLWAARARGGSRNRRILPPAGIFASSANWDNKTVGYCPSFAKQATSDTFGILMQIIFTAKLNLSTIFKCFQIYM